MVNVEIWPAGQTGQTQQLAKIRGRYNKTQKSVNKFSCFGDSSETRGPTIVENIAFFCGVFERLIVRLYAIGPPAAMPPAAMTPVAMPPVAMAAAAGVCAAAGVGGCECVGAANSGARVSVPPVSAHSGEREATSRKAPGALGERITSTVRPFWRARVEPPLSGMQLRLRGRWCALWTRSGS